LQTRQAIGLARELFKPSTDSASLKLQTKKTFFVWISGFLGMTLQVGVFGFFLANFTWPWAPTQSANILAQDFSGN